MADSPTDPKVPIIYTTDLNVQYRTTASKSIADALSAVKAPITMPPLPKNIVPRKLILQLDPKANQGQTGNIKIITVPSPAIPAFATGASAIPIVKHGAAQMFIPVRREPEKTIDLFKIKGTK